MYQESLFFYRPLFMLQILIAELIFCKYLKKRKYFYLRTIISFLFAISISFLVPIITENTLYGSFLFFILFLFSIVILVFLYQENFKIIVFAASCGFTLQHIASEIYELIYASIGISDTSNVYGNLNYGSINGVILFGNDWFLIVLYFSIYFLIYLLFSQILMDKCKRENIINLSKISLFFIFIFIILADVIFGAVVIWSIPNNDNKTSLIMLHIYNIACCILILFIMFELVRRRNAETELIIIKELHTREKEKYEIAKKNRDILNLKCHDLKHQIHNIGKARDLQNEVINEIEETINIYDTIYNTGLEALDVILGEKDMLCRKENIRFTSIVDGKLLSFLSESDVYSLFGNILDNAIEANRKLNNEARVIHLSIKKVHNFIVIQEYNGYDGNIVTENGIIKSTKNDKTWHGYGLKSIQYIVEKYHGELKIETKNQTFNLNIIFSDKS